MAAPIKPQKVPANGKDTWWAVPAIADINNPLDSEINSPSGLNFTCFLLADGAQGITGTVNKVQLPRLLCELQTTEALDNVVFSLPDVQAVFDPQADDMDNAKKAWQLFKDGFSGFLVRRQGVVNNLDADVIAGDYVDVFQVDTGPAWPDKTATDASGIYSFTFGGALLAQAFNVEVLPDAS